MIEPQQSEGSNWVAVTSVAPALEFNDFYLLRVLIVGQVVDGGSVTVVTVGSYLDVELSPGRPRSENSAARRIANPLKRPIPSTNDAAT